MRNTVTPSWSIHNCVIVVSVRKRATYGSQGLEALKMLLGEIAHVMITLHHSTFGISYFCKRKLGLRRAAGESVPLDGLCQHPWLISGELLVRSPPNFQSHSHTAEKGLHRIEVSVNEASRV